MTLFSQKEFQLQEIQTVEIYQEAHGVYAIYFDQQGNYIYSLAEYHKLKIYDLRSRSTKLIIFCRCECIMGLRVCEGISTIITCWEPGLLIIHKIETRNWKILKRQYIKSQIGFTHISNINQQKNHFAISKKDGSISIYHNSKNLFQPFQEIDAQKKAIRPNVIFIDSTLFHSNCNARFVEQFQLNENDNRYELLKKITVSYPIQEIYGAFNRILILCSNNKYCQYIKNKENDNFEKRNLSKEKGCAFSKIQFLDEGNSFVELSYQKEIKLWKFVNEELQIIKIIKFQQNISSASVSKKKNALIIGFSNGTMKILI